MTRLGLGLGLGTIRNKKVATVTPVQPTIVIYDTFTDTNTTPLPSHTIAPTNVPSTAWVNLKTGGYGGRISSNRAIGNFNSIENYCGLEGGNVNISVSATFNLSGATLINRFILRMENLTPYVSPGDSYSNCWQVRFGNGLIAIYEHNNSLAGALRASTALTTAAGTDYALMATVEGTTLTGYVNGVAKVNYTMGTHLTATKVGIAFGSATSQIDDFKVFF